MGNEEGTPAIRGLLAMCREKLRYMHRNPVVRGLVEKPVEWPWSNFRYYATGIEGTVEIESFWTGWY